MGHFASLRLRSVLIFLAVVFALSCQQQTQKKYTEGGESTGGTVAGGGSKSSSSKQLVTIPVRLTPKGSSAAKLNLDDYGLNVFSLLGSATTYNISLEGCASGYTSTANQASTALQVYKFDRTCKAKLTQFTYNARTYIPTAGDPFTTWDANDSATFDEAGEPGTHAVLVKVISQLADPVSGTEAVVYQFSELIKGSDETLMEAQVGAAHSMTVASEPPPSFTIHSVQFVSINASGGGQFRITLECTSDIGATDECEGADMNTMTYKLVEDTYGSTLTIGQANALFPAGETAVTLPANREAPGGTTTNGGFKTALIDGPNAMADHPNMIFIIQAADASYQYFNIDIATLTQD